MPFVALLQTILVFSADHGVHGPGRSRSLRVMEPKFYQLGLSGGCNYLSTLPLDGRISVPALLDASIVDDAGAVDDDAAADDDDVNMNENGDDSASFRSGCVREKHPIIAVCL